MLDSKSPALAHPELATLADSAEVALPSRSAPVEKLALDVRGANGRGTIQKGALLRILEQTGIPANDPRLAETMMALASLRDYDILSVEAFIQSTRNNAPFIHKILRGELIIPDFEDFRAEIRRIYQVTAANTNGNVADYIPQLRRVHPDQYGVALCTIDGQRFSLGDSATPFCVQSAAKPINYCLALEEHGEETVHRHVGREPSGKGFNELALNNRGLPHNPMVNAGGIMCCALIRPNLDNSDRFDHVMNLWRTMGGGMRPGFNNAVYLSERQTADRNFALGYFMREKGAFPEGTDLIETLEFYFQCCSIEVTAEHMAVIAGTLANGGVCPTTGVRVFQPDTVKYCLSLMSSCGMYDFSGEFAFSIGLPAKSGVSGVVMVVVPNVMGLCLWSPRLDDHGNSVRGIDFCRELVRTYNFHNYDSLITGRNQKKDPRLRRCE